jgi:thymidine kinase
MKDVRYVDATEGTVSTHDLVRHEACPVKSLYDGIDQASSQQVVGIDEGQFFPRIVEFCEEMTRRGKIVIVASIFSTFERKPYAGIAELLSRSEYIDKLQAVCRVCKLEGSFSKRCGDSTTLEEVGGLEDYWSVCRTCHSK